MNLILMKWKLRGLISRLRLIKEGFMSLLLMSGLMRLGILEK